jgi:hypothetical protein
MRGVVLGSLLVLMGCAAAPSEYRSDPALLALLEGQTDLALSGRPAAREIDVNVEDADLAEVMGEIARRVGRTIIVKPYVHETVTIKLERMPWHEVVDRIAGLCDCEVRDEGNQTVVWKLQKFKIQVGNRSLGELFRFVASQNGYMPIVLAADVDRLAAPVCAEDGETVPLFDYVDRLAAQNHLHVTHFGLGSVVTAMPGEGDVAPILTGNIARAVAWKAPARAWFELLERATGEPVQHGKAPIVGLEFVGQIRDLTHGSALASRVRWDERELQDLPPEQQLPSGRRIPLALQAVLGIDSRPIPLEEQLLDGNERRLALIDGRVLAVGDELADHLRVAKIEYDRVELLDRDQPFVLKPPE